MNLPRSHKWHCVFFFVRVVSVSNVISALYLFFSVFILSMRIMASSAAQSRGPSHRHCVNLFRYVLRRNEFLIRGENLFLKKQTNTHTTSGTNGPARQQHTLIKTSVPKNKRTATSESMSVAICRLLTLLKWAFHVFQNLIATQTPNI